MNYVGMTRTSRFVRYQFYWRIAKKKGSGTAKVAVARKLLESIHQMLRTGQPFNAEAWTKTAG